MGSEMCIRDSPWPTDPRQPAAGTFPLHRIGDNFPRSAIESPIGKNRMKLRMPQSRGFEPPRWSRSQHSNPGGARCLSTGTGSAPEYYSVLPRHFRRPMSMGAHRPHEHLATRIQTAHQMNAYQSPHTSPCTRIAVSTRANFAIEP